MVVGLRSLQRFFFTAVLTFLSLFKNRNICKATYFCFLLIPLKKEMNIPSIKKVKTAIFKRRPHSYWWYQWYSNVHPDVHNKIHNHCLHSSALSKCLQQPNLCLVGFDLRVNWKYYQKRLRRQQRDVYHGYQDHQVSINKVKSSFF